MNILYLINSKEYSYHKTIIGQFVEAVPGTVTDVADYEDPFEGYREIKKRNPQVIISFDLAGHIFRTGMDELTLNALPCRIANILFQKRNVYGPQIKKRENLSTFMYLSSKDDLPDAVKNLEDVPNIYLFPPIEYKNTEDSAVKENVMAIKSWWSDFKQEAMINEDINI